jgi:TRAP-type C4-dicarboxylate transport system substrate-binding protein
VSAKAWARLNSEDQAILRSAAQVVMGEQKNEVREGLDETMTTAHVLHCPSWVGEAL